MNDDELVLHAVAAADQAQTGTQPTQAHLSLLRAIAATRDETRRHELERDARSHLGTLTDVGIAVLKAALALA